MENQCGPFGIKLSDQFANTVRLGAAFSSDAWENAKQNGCVSCPGKSPRYPQWPPERDAWVYPTLASESRGYEITTGGSETVLESINNVTVSKFDPSIRPLARNGIQVTGLVANMLSNNPPPEQMFRPLVDFDAAASVSFPQDLRWAQSIMNPVRAEQLVPAVVAEVPVPATVMTQTEPSWALPAVSDSVADYQPVQGSCTVWTFGTVFPCMSNTVRGIFYDLSYWGELPVTGFWSKLGYVLTREDRIWYLALWILIIALLTLVLVLLFRTLTSSCGIRTKKPSEIIRGG